MYICQIVITTESLVMASTWRNCKSITKLVILLALISRLHLVQAQGPTVTVREGKLMGKTVTFQEDRFINVTKQVDLYLGVPFAEPPVRFAAPVAKSAWTDTWNATSFRPSCMQIMQSSYFPDPSEDCLYLNVYTPNPKPIEAAVMVFIHGGSFATGTAMTYDFHGVPLVVVGDVIVVALNYRLNILSRFSTGDGAATGNYGMLDQTMALQWVYDNIDVFGGDRDRITIFGESAGAASVNFHLLSPLSRGLFNQAIMQSGAAVAQWAFQHTPDSDRQKAEALATQMGCDVTDSAEIISCLRDKDAELLLNTAAQIYISYQVVQDGVFLQDSPLNLYQKNEFAHVPTMNGFNRDEGTFAVVFSDPDSLIGSPSPPFIPRTVFDAVVRDNVAIYGDVDSLDEAVYQEYVDWTTADRDDVDMFQPTVEVISDVLFSCPTDWIVRAHEAAGDPVFKYFMTHAPSRTSYFEFGEEQPFTPWLDASHAEDLLFVFGMPFIDQLEDIHGHNLTDDEKALSVDVMTLWTNFAKSGDPSKADKDALPGEGKYSWPPYSIPELRHKELSIEMGEGRAVRARQCHLWNEYLVQLGTFFSGRDESELEWREQFNSWKADMADWRKTFTDYTETGGNCEK